MNTLKYYDEDFKYTTGNATPKGKPEQIIANGAHMYKELSPETDQFFSFMQQNEFMDLVSKKGKQAGGYCTYLFKQKVPFIFSNFNGTYEDVDVLTHEVGHAFQAYQTDSLPVPEYTFPTSDAAEIHSMSMKFFAWPWMELLGGSLSLLEYEKTLLTESLFTSQKGFEPLTDGLEGRCSIQLSYWDMIYVIKKRMRLLLYLILLYFESINLLWAWMCLSMQTFNHILQTSLSLPSHNLLLRLGQCFAIRD